MHYTEFEKQVQSIFQVKIKEDYINKLFQGVNTKLNNLQIQLKEIQSNRQQNETQNLYKTQNQQIIKQQINTSMLPLACKIDQLQFQIQQNSRNQKDIETSLQQKFKQIVNGRIQFFQQQRIKNNEQFIILKQEIERIIFRNQAIQKVLNDHIEQSFLREQKHDFQIEKVWVTLNGSTQQQTKVEPKKKKEAKHSIFYELSQNKENKLKQDLVQSQFQKGKITTKGIIQSRKSLNKQKIQSRRQSKTVQYACLLLKVQTLERKMQEFSTIKNSLLNVKNLSEQQIGSNQIISKFQGSQQRILIERKKAKLSKNINRINRSSIVKNEYSNQDIDSSRDDFSEINNGVTLQLKKIHQKLADLKYKYTLLQQNHEIVLNKISRVNQIESSLNNKMEQIQKLRIDLSTINEINMRFRKIQASYQQQQHKYVFNETYTKDIKQVKDNLKDIEAKINKMANKSQVKEAFVFIETKIKQMALVLTDKFQSQKEGAINKIKQVKCLTCDKECDENYTHIRMSLNSPQYSRNIKTCNEFSRLKRKARVTQKKIKTEAYQNF